MTWVLLQFVQPLLLINLKSLTNVNMHSKYLHCVASRISIAFFFNVMFIDSSFIIGH